MIKKLLIVLLIVIIVFAIYIKVNIGKLNYDFEVKSYKVVKLSVQDGGVINLNVDITVTNPFFFSVPVGGLYYEIYYKDHLLGKSTDVSSFTIKAKGDTTISQSIDIYVDYQTLDVAKNYFLKIKTDFTAKVYVKFLGIGIKIKNINFTY